jgi:hypothetical protein
MPDRDEHYVKYRVFHEPEDVGDLGHPVPIEAEYPMQIDSHGTWSLIRSLEEVEGLFFVLRPENDHYARVAMAAYAYACRKEYPHLASDIIQMIEELEWQEETGQYGDDDDEPHGDAPPDNVVQMMKGTT